MTIHESGTITDKLKLFNLSPQEGQVYLYLLERGSAFGGSKIAAGAGLHRQNVHTALKKLTELGLIEEMPAGKRPRYRALSPKRLGVIAKQKYEEAERIVRDL